jgi:osmotically-inducible protein OsmY
MGSVASEVANDAMLVQLVRGAFAGRSRGTPRINVGSCDFVVTLHGSVSSVEERDRLEAAARAVRGVRDVINRLGVARGQVPRGAVSERPFRGI